MSGGPDPIERVARLLEQAQVQTADDRLFERFDQLFIGTGPHPVMGLYFDSQADCLRALPFGSDPERACFLHFDFDLDPPISKVERAAKTHMLIMAAGLRSGFRPHLAQIISNFVADGSR